MSVHNLPPGALGDLHDGRIGIAHGRVRVQVWIVDDLVVLVTNDAAFADNHPANARALHEVYGPVDMDEALNLIGIGVQEIVIDSTLIRYTGGVVVDAEN